MGIKTIIHLPHSSAIIPDKTGFLVDDEKLNDEMLLLTDWYTDDLFAFSEGIPIIADFNRIFCDVERFEDDNEELMSKFGMGATYTHRDNGAELRDVTPELKRSILNKYYHPHHQKLSAAVSEQLVSNARALIIDCHSFSDKPFKRDLDQQTPRPGICIGTDEYHTPSDLVDFTYRYFKWAGYTVQLNTPYSGSIVPMDYYQKNDRVHSIMIEVNRDLYMVPGTNKKGRGYIKAQRTINKYLRKVSELIYCDYPNFRNEDLPIPPSPERKL